MAVGFVPSRCGLQLGGWRGGDGACDPSPLKSLPTLIHSSSPELPDDEQEDEDEAEQKRELLEDALRDLERLDVPDVEHDRLYRARCPRRQRPPYVVGH